MENTPAFQNNNPGNLKFAGQQGAVNNNGFAKFSSPDDGYIALMNDVHGKLTGATSTGLTGNHTLNDFAVKYAPPTENDSEQYTLNLANQLKVPPDTKLSDLQNRVPEMAQAIAHNEDQNFAKKYSVGVSQQDASQGKDQSGYITQPTFSQSQTSQGAVPQTQDKGIIDQVSSRVGDAGASIGKAVGGVVDIAKGNTVQGGKEIFHGLTQGAGAVAGGFGDVVGKIIEKTPVVGDFVKGLETVIGSGVKGFASSEAGQSVIKSVSEWAKQHPEMSKDIGAGVNIATAIPILKGFGVLKNVVLDSASMALKSTAEKSVLNDLTKVAGKRAIPEDIKTLVDERAIPDIVDGKYSTKEASQQLDDAIAKIEDEKLQPALAKANTEQISQRIPLETYRKQAIADAEDALMPTDGVEKLFDFVQKKYGDAPTLQQMNEAKRTFAGRIKESAYGSPEASALKITRSALQKSIEDGATAMGLGDVASINQEMARLIKAQKQLNLIEGKNVQLGTTGGMIKNIATGAGEMAGNASGIPIAGAFIGRQTGGYVGKKVAGVGQGILNRTSKEAARQPIKSVLKKTAGMIGGTMVNKANR